MSKKLIIIISLIIVILLSVILLYKYNQHILSWIANPKINVCGIKLMMPENEVKGLIGEEEQYIQGFGGYRLEYQSKGISLNFLNDRDTDFYCKVNSIEVTDSQYAIFGVSVGDEFEKSLNSIHKQGFARQEMGFSGYWKMNMYIVLDNNGNKVQKITIGIRDRVSSSRVY